MPSRSERQFTWPEPPERLFVVFCSVCNAYLGIHDVDRMQHEHFEQTARCRGGHYRAAVYGVMMLGTYSEALREMREGS